MYIQQNESEDVEQLSIESAVYPVLVVFWSAFHRTWRQHWCVSVGSDKVVVDGLESLRWKRDGVFVRVAQVAVKNHALALCKATKHQIQKFRNLCFFLGDQRRMFLFRNDTQSENGF
jgi:hypothetical protein